MDLNTLLESLTSGNSPDIRKDIPERNEREIERIYDAREDLKYILHMVQDKVIIFSLFIILQGT